MQKSSQIHLKELEMFLAQLGQIATVSTFLSSIAWVGMAMGPPQVTFGCVWACTFVRVYYILAAFAVGTNVSTTAVATFTIMSGARKA